MTTQILPQDLTATDHKLCVYDYHITNRCDKNKITLQQNVFSFLQDGTKGLIHFDKHTKIDNSQFLLIKSGNCLMTEGLSSANVYRSILFFFDDETLLNFIEKNQIKLQSVSNSKPFSVLKYDDYVHNFSLSLLQAKQTSAAFQSALLRAKFDEIMFYLIEKIGVGFLQTVLMQVSKVDIQFKNVIESNVNNVLSVEELAFLCNMSVSTFKREFQKCYNTSPIKWFQERRLEHSAFLLKINQQRASDIYLEAGFENLSSFVQSFKQKFGQTPKQYQLRQ
jgi:AraC-like DNA-binding protein